MAIGQCQFMACASMLGSPFRARFRLPAAGLADYESVVMRRVPAAVEHEPEDLLMTEVLLCPDHERLAKEIRDQWEGRLVLTAEGHVYSSLWMDSLGFLTR